MMYRTLAITVAPALFAMAASAGSVGNKAAIYYCNRYESFITFQRDTVFKEFGVEFPTGKGARSLSMNVSRAKLKAKSCESDSFYCVRELPIEGTKPTSANIYALPKVVTAGDEYAVAGTKFMVREFPSLPDQPRAVVVVAVPGDNGPRFKMYVKEGIGVSGLYFERLTSTEPAGLVYEHISCSLETKRGLFPGVMINPFDSSMNTQDVD